MSSFKRLNQSDVFVLPYTANKQYRFPSESFAANGIHMFTGEKITGRFDPENEVKVQGEYKRLMYDTVNQLFYQEYSGSLLNTQSLAQSNYYESASIYRPTGSYDNIRIWNDRALQYPSGTGDHVKIISIPKRFYGQSIKRGTLVLSSSVFHLTDDKRGNIVDASLLQGDFNEDYSNDFFLFAGDDAGPIGNIYYSQGLVVITSPYYAALFDDPESCSTVTSLTADVVDDSVHFAFTGSISDVLFYDAQLVRTVDNTVVMSEKINGTEGLFEHVAAGEYFVRVQTHCSDNNVSDWVISDPVNVIKVVLLCPVITSVKLTSPSFGIITVSLTIPQTDIYGTASTLQLISASTGEIVQQMDYVYGKTNQFIGVAEGQYKVTVIRNCNNGVDSDPVSSAPITIKKPLVCSPATGLLFSTDGKGSLDAAWTNSVSAMDNYTFSLYKDNAVYTTVVKSPNDAPSYHLTGMPPGTYYYRLRTNCSNGLQATVDSLKVIITVCGLTIPSLSVTNDGSHYFHLNWINVGGTPQSFTFEYSTDGGTTWSVADMVVDSNNQAAISAAPMDDTKNYRWKITPYCSPNRPGKPAVKDWIYVAPTCAVVAKPTLSVSADGHVISFTTTSVLNEGETMTYKIYRNGVLAFTEENVPFNFGNWGPEQSGTYTVEAVRNCTNGLSSTGVLSDPITVNIARTYNLVPVVTANGRGQVLFIECRLNGQSVPAPFSTKMEVTYYYADNSMGGQISPFSSVVNLQGGTTTVFVFATPDVPFNSTQIISVTPSTDSVGNRYVF